MLTQLVYVSRRDINCSNKDIDNILAACKRNNPDLGITGILLYTEEKFIQLVEGEKSIILSLYDKIKTDARHKDCVMISCSPIEEKAFPSWHMGSRKIDEEQIKFSTEISESDKRKFNEILSGNVKSEDALLGTLKKFF